VSGESISIGSLKSNAVDKLNGVVGNGVLFISEWHKEPDGGAALYIEHDGTPVYWSQFFKAEVMVLRFLDRWCSAINMRLKICGREKHLESLERQFYANYLTESTWEYIPRMDSYGCYKLVDAAEIVVFIDSTLGYEAIGRGKKTASFSCRMSSPQRKFYEFGWPEVLPNNGPFWTNEQDETQFERVMHFLNTVSDDEWEHTRKYYTSEIMEFDSGNTRFIALLDQLLPQSANQQHAN
jgi:surface carbohydrate biosynthesis protein